VFILIGSDGKEYGPATADQVKQWIADGRATLETLGKRVGEGAWRRLMEFSEFQRPAPIADVPPPRVATPPATAAVNAAAPTATVSGNSPGGDQTGALPSAGGAVGSGAGGTLPSGASLAGTTAAGAAAGAVGQAGAGAGGVSGGAAGPVVVDPRAYAEELIGRAGKLRIWHCVGRAWRLTTSNFWAIVGGTFIGLLVLGVIQMIPLLGTVAGFFLSGVLYGGLYLYYLKYVRGESADLGVIFSGFSATFGPLMLASLVSSLLTTLGILLLILPGIYLAIAYLFTFLLIQDRKLDFWCAMEVSRRVITAQWWRVFGLMIVAGFFACLGIIGLFIGIFVTLPILFGAIVYAYEDLVNPPSVAAAPAPASAPAVEP
jgi:hypothetical protein